MKKIILSIIITFSFVSCSEDFFDTAPIDKVPTDQVFSNYSGASTALTGVYSAMQSSNYYGRNFYASFDASSDDVVVGLDNSGRFINENRMTKTSQGTQGAGGLLLRGYFVIRETNNIINNADAISDATEDQLNDLKGQAYAVRALAYFDMVRSFAFPYTAGSDVGDGANGAGANLGVPITLEAGVTGYGRSTVEEVYNQIISDLTTAEGLISAEARTTKLNKSGVKSLLSKVYLYKGDYSNAFSKSQEVINSGAYSLTPNASFVSAWSATTNPDMIFTVGQTATDNQETNSLGNIYVKEGYGDLRPTTDLMNLYADTDVRKQLFREVSGSMYSYKYVSKLAGTPVIRLSDVYLIAAESAARLGNASQSRDYLFAVQSRADQNAVMSNNSGTVLLDEILTERRKELAFEGNRVFDLLRYQKGFTRNDNAGLPSLTISYPNCQLILPIPQNEIDRNPLMVQTSCYN